MLSLFKFILLPYAGAFIICIFHPISTLAILLSSPLLFCWACGYFDKVSEPSPKHLEIEQIEKFLLKHKFKHLDTSQKSRCNGFFPYVFNHKHYELKLMVNKERNDFNLEYTHPHLDLFSETLKTRLHLYEQKYNLSGEDRIHMIFELIPWAVTELKKSHGHDRIEPRGDDDDDQDDHGVDGFDDSEPGDPDNFGTGFDQIKSTSEFAYLSNRNLIIYVWGKKKRNHLNCKLDYNFNATVLFGQKGKVIDWTKDATEDERICRAVMKCRSFPSFLKSMVRTIEERNYFTIGINCIAGKHRSVTCAMKLKQFFYPKAEIYYVELKKVDK